MKQGVVLKVFTAFAALVLALNVCAQTSGTVATPAGASARSSKAGNRALSKKIRRALAKVNGLDTTHVYVKVVNGAVTLTGFVDDQVQIDKAGKSARAVDGVVSVANKLSVRSPE